jgi:hypothetical protein
MVQEGAGINLVTEHSALQFVIFCLTLRHLLAGINVATRNILKHYAQDIAER